MFNLKIFAATLLVAVAHAAAIGKRDVDIVARQFPSGSFPSDSVGIPSGFPSLSGSGSGSGPGALPTGSFSFPSMSFSFPSMSFSFPSISGGFPSDSGSFGVPSVTATPQPSA